MLMPGGIDFSQVYLGSYTFFHVFNDMIAFWMLMNANKWEEEMPESPVLP